MKTLTKADFRVPALLVMLSLIPAVGGVVRLQDVAAAGPLSADNARFLESPAVIVVHLVSATVYSVLGAFQFSAGLRRRWPRWHRLAGRFLAVCGALAAVTGIWMTLTFAIPTKLQGPLLLGTRLAVGVAVLFSLVKGVDAARRGKLTAHEAWMIRAYALGQGAGTQGLLMGPLIVLTGEVLYLQRDLLMLATWLINWGVAEWIIRRRNPSPHTGLLNRVTLRG